MKDKTKVKADNVGKVAKVLIKNPNATRREIEKKTKLHPLTIQKAKEELNQNGTKDETIAYIVTSAKNRIRKVSGIFDRYIDQIEEKEELNNKDIALAKDIVKDDMARVTVLGGSVTDKDGGLKSMNDLLDDIIQ